MIILMRHSRHPSAFGDFLEKSTNSSLFSVEKCNSVNCTVKVVFSYLLLKEVVVVHCYPILVLFQITQRNDSYWQNFKFLVEKVIKVIFDLKNKFPSL